MQTDSCKPRPIYRRDLLPFSETIIRKQGEALERLEAFYSKTHRATQMKPVSGADTNASQWSDV